MEETKSVSKKIMCTMKVLLVSYLFTGVLMVLLAMILCKLGLSETKVEMGIFVIYILSTLFGGYGVGKLVEVQKYLWGMVLGLCYFAMLLLVTLCINKTLGDVNVVSTMLVCMGCGTVGGMLA